MEFSSAGGIGVPFAASIAATCRLKSSGFHGTPPGGIAPADEFGRPAIASIIGALSAAGVGAAGADCGTVGAGDAPCVISGGSAAVFGAVSLASDIRPAGGSEPKGQTVLSRSATAHHSHAEPWPRSTEAASPEESDHSAQSPFEPRHEPHKHSYCCGRRPVPNDLRSRKSY